MSQNTISAALQTLQEQYTNKNFEAGVELLIQTKTQWEPAQFHELLGSFYLKLENFAAARYHFELSLSKGGLNPAISHNLEYVIEKMGLASAHGTSWWDNLINILSLMPFEFWAAITLILLSFSFWKVRKRWQSGQRKIVIFLWLVALLPQVIYWSVFENRLSAIVLEETPIHEGPSAVFESPKTLRAGEKVIIGKNGEGWSFIVAPKVLSGWIDSTKLGYLGRH